MFEDAYRKRRVLVTGHTGFKGSWLALWLQSLGADVTGIALAPDTMPNHWELLKLDIKEHRIDIRDTEAVRRAVAEAKPDIVFHLAAQSLVRRSYRDPLATWATNVMGTAGVLDACRHAASVRAVVAVTTDKCYENSESPQGYREDDRLGGHDAYSASKAAAELVAASYRSAFFSDADAPLLATARAGNVIGGGDWAEDRLVPDLARAMAVKRPLAVRSPEATRPWQHVLEPLAGYLQLGEKLLAGQKKFAEAWNFGPDRDSTQTVGQLLSGLRRYWPDIQWKAETAPQPHETTLLMLDSAKARRQLGWRPRLTFDQQLAMTAGWYRAFQEKGEVISGQQLVAYRAALA